jgi:hypothetical protein
MKGVTRAKIPTRILKIPVVTSNHRGSSVFSDEHANPGSKDTGYDRKKSEYVYKEIKDKTGRHQCNDAENDRNQPSQGKRFSINDTIETIHNLSSMPIDTGGIKFW